MTLREEPAVRGLRTTEGYGMGTDAGAKHRQWRDVVNEIGGSRSWWVCTVRSGNRPHAMPVWGVVVEDRMIFSTDPDSIKGRNLARRPAVIVHLESGDDVVIVEGRAERIDHSALPRGFVRAYANKVHIRNRRLPTGVRLLQGTPQFGARMGRVPVSRERRQVGSDMSDGVQVVRTSDERPLLRLVEGEGCARAVIWPGIGSRNRSLHIVELEPGARTVVQTHSSDAVYHLNAGSAEVIDDDSGTRQRLRVGSMVHIDQGTAYHFEAVDHVELVGGPCPSDDALYEHLDT